VAWAQVDSTPAGADIWVDGITTGRKTPSRVEIPSGIHNIMLKLDGYRPTRSAVEASEGGTVSISPNLQKVRLKPVAVCNLSYHFSWHSFSTIAQCQTFQALYSCGIQGINVPSLFWGSGASVMRWTVAGAPGCTDRLSTR